MPQRKTILIVEDDFEIREELHRLLAREGYEVVNAANGMDALELLSRIRRPCLILLDLLMPVMNGERFLEAMRSSDTLISIPVVVVSVAPRPPPGATAFIKKPFELQTLLATVKKLTADVA